MTALLRTARRLLLSLLIAAPLTATAQNALRIDIAGVGAKQIPIAIFPFDTNDPLLTYGQTVAQVVRSNLARRYRLLMWSTTS